MEFTKKDNDKIIICEKINVNNVGNCRKMGYTSRSCLKFNNKELYGGTLC